MRRGVQRKESKVDLESDSDPQLRITTTRSWEPFMETLPLERIWLHSLTDHGHLPDEIWSP
jgi:hypothetical protein